MSVIDQLRNSVILVEPLARSTGHQTWFLGKFAGALVAVGVRPTVITFDGMHEDADLELEYLGCEVHRAAASLPASVRRIFTRVTGVASGGTAAPSSVRRPVQLYIYNQVAILVSIWFACRLPLRREPAVLHLLCHPSLLTLSCVAGFRRRATYVVITAFASLKRFKGSSLVRRLCTRNDVTLSVQTQALLEDWSNWVGRKSVAFIPLPSDPPSGGASREECRAALQLPQDRPILAVIGCISPQKGYVELYRAINALPKTFRVLLIGDTPQWIVPNPLDVAREAGWADDTIFRLQFVPEREMPFVFGAVDAVALLYREPNASSGILSCCRQHGVPVLATRFGEIGEAVRLGGFGIAVDPDNAEDVRAGVTQLLCGQRRVQVPPDAEKGGPPSWAEAARAHIKVYSALLGLRACSA